MGLGEPAKVLDVVARDKFARVMAPALGSSFEVPFGWHVTDDGKRTVVFDENHFVQIQLDVRPTKQGAKAVLEALRDAQRAAQPHLKAHLMDNPDGSIVLIMQNFKMGDDVVTRSYIARAGNREAEIIVAQVTASAADLIRALNLSEVIFRRLKPQEF